MVNFPLSERPWFVRNGQRVEVPVPEPERPVAPKAPAPAAQAPADEAPEPKADPKVETKPEPKAESKPKVKAKKADDTQTESDGSEEGSTKS